MRRKLAVAANLQHNIVTTATALFRIKMELSIMSNLQQPTLAVDRIISRAEFRSLTGISRTTEWRLSQKGLLPDCVIIDNVNLGYRESSYGIWLDKNSFAA